MNTISNNIPEEKSVIYTVNNEKTADKKILYQCVKRVFDIIASSLLIIVLFIPMIIIAVLIKLESKGPALFKQQRTGLNAKPFTFYKFRSMHIEAPANCATRDFSDSDAYITKIGGFLRKTSFDEIPQLFNIFKGDMSFIGPRPVVLTEEELISKRLVSGAYNIRPGLTGFAQVNGRDFVGIDSKVKYDSIYAKEASIWFDFKIFAKTIICVVARLGINEGAVKQEEKSESCNDTAVLEEYEVR